MRLFTIATFLFGCSPGWLLGDQESAPRVRMPLGIIEGFYNVSRGGKKYEAYQGIRFALPPTKEYRFKMARAVTEPWEGVVEAKKYGPSCVQSGAVPNLQGGARTDAEDCLFLNVYTPVGTCRPEPSFFDAGWDLYNELWGWFNSCSELPVVLFIHGGAFRSGNTRSYRPTYIMDLPVIFVQITYRIGVLGFLSTQDDVVPGNLGLKDQVVAMRWVKKNIKYFGGDPEKIMIVGQSAGGASVHYHYLTDVTKNLFRCGMSLSGTALTSWTETEASREKAERLATIVNCPTSNTVEMVDCMRNRTDTALVQASMQFSPWVYNPITPFGPTVEKWSGKGKGDEFIMIDRLPYESLKKRKVQKKPWITSVVSQDGLFPAAEFLANETLLKQLNDHWDQIAPLLLDYNYTVPRRYQPEVSEIIRKHYFNDRPIDNSSVNKIVDMVTDRLFKSDAELAAKLQARAYDAVWFYDFGYRQKYSLSDTLSNTTTNWGVAHLDDLAYVLDAFFNSTTTQKDRDMQNVFFKLWLSFAYKKVPDVGVRWDKVKPVRNLRFLHILGPDKIFMDRSKNFGQEHFWHALRFNENANYEPFPDE